MEREETAVEQTQHALLVAWGWFAEHTGLIQAVEGVPLHQKRYRYTPQAKVLEFFVAILAGLKQLQEISRSAHPLDLDAATVQAWGQAGWADYSGVSRTLRSLSWTEARQLAAALDRVSQPFLQAELEWIGSQGKRLCYDGDLTGLPVSNTSRTYPNAVYGYMDEEIRLGYQAGVVSLVSEHYGRLWLSSLHLPGDTVSLNQAEALVLAAEAKTGRRPKRRTDWLGQRIQACEKRAGVTQQRYAAQQALLHKAQQRLVAARQAAEECQASLAALEANVPVHASSLVAQARQRWQAAEQHQQSRLQTCQAVQRRLEKTQALRSQQQAELTRLQERLAHFEDENRSNPQPVEAQFRLDAGFGSYENIALLVEMGYEVYTKAHNHHVVRYLQRRLPSNMSWERVGANAEMVAWSQEDFKHCPYPLDAGLERFSTGRSLKHSALLHFGVDPVIQHLPDWFHAYNARQIIEAGIKESKQVFYLHKLKVRSEPAIYLQECFVTFAANFIRWASRWLTPLPDPASQSLQIQTLGVKRQVHVGAHVSAQVIRDPIGKLLRFSDQSAFAGRILRCPALLSSGP